MEFDTDINNIKGISLRDVIMEVWRARLILLAAILVATLLGLAYVLLVPQAKTASMTVMPIPESEFLKYRQLITIRNSIDQLADKQADARNAAKGIQPANKATLRPSPVFEFDKDYLLNILFEDLMDRETLKAALNSAMGNKAGEVDEDSLDAVTVESFRYKIIPPTKPEDVLNSRTKVVNPYWTIQYEGDHGDIVRRVMREAMAASTANTAKVLNQRFQQTVAVLARDRNDMKRDVEGDIGDLRQRYTADTKGRIAFLKEQAQIARAIGTAKATLNVQPLGETNQVLPIVSTDPDKAYYLRGYEAIEKEINEIRARKTADDFIPDLQPLLTMARAIDRDDLVERLTAAFNKTPLAEGKFVAANYKINSVEIEYKRSRVITEIYFILGGALLGLLVIFLRAMLRETPKA